VLVIGYSSSAFIKPTRHYWASAGQNRNKQWRERARRRTHVGKRCHVTCIAFHSTV